MSELTEALDEQRRRIAEIAEITPSMLEAFERRLGLSTSAHIATIDALQAGFNAAHRLAQLSLFDSQGQLNQRHKDVDQLYAELSKKELAFEQKCKEMNQLRVDLIKEKQAFEQEKDRFNNKSFWKRVFEQVWTRPSN